MVCFLGGCVRCKFDFEILPHTTNDIGNGEKAKNNYRTEDDTARQRNVNDKFVMPHMTYLEERSKEETRD